LIIYKENKIITNFQTISQKGMSLLQITQSILTYNQNLMKKLPLILLLLCCTFQMKAATDITTTSVSGQWTLTGSPYKIHNDITISVGQTLRIDPGVEVVFQGAYKLTVWGYLRAYGTPGQYIDFKIHDTAGWTSSISTNGGWNGVVFQPITSGSPLDTPMKF
jgi:hypothetical protein